MGDIVADGAPRGHSYPPRKLAIATEQDPPRPATDSEIPSEAAWQTYLLLVTILPESILETLLAPTIPNLLRSLDAKPDLAGVLMGAFYTPLFLTNMLWGSLSDKAVPGPKPILIVSLIVGGVTSAVLGVAESFTTAYMCRLLAGVFGASSTVVKGLIGEIHRDEFGRAWGYSRYGLLFAASGILGPIIGGLLAHDVTLNSVDAPPGESPLDKPRDQREFLDRYPNFWPCAVGAILSVISLILSVKYLHVRGRGGKRVRAVDDEEDLTPVKSPTGGSFAWRLISPLLKAMSSTVMFPITLYMVIAFFSFLTSSIAVSKLIMQVLAFRPMIANFGGRGSYRIAMLTLVPACAGVVVMGQIIRGEDTGALAWSFTLVVTLMFGFVEAVAYLSVISMISNAVEPSELGATHGLAATCAALVRAISPPFASYLWIAGADAGVPSFVFFFIAFCGAAAVFAMRWEPVSGQTGGYTTVADATDEDGL
ncbi:hypothetical protein HK101_003467 [Irineochytrium annulatum]|nr:hypothetical protein HK101_003467 [Irineochytrium annulatum]